MVNPTTRIAALALLASLVAFAPSASAAYNRCTNEPGDDTWIAPLGPSLGVGLDGPLLDHNGVQVCVGPTAYSVETNTDPLGTDGAPFPPPGTGVVVRACSNTGDQFDECNVDGGGVILLGWTGVTLSCGPTVCVWVNGDPLI